MRILAIDTALPAVSVCVLDSSDKTPLASETIAMSRGHAEAIMPMIERVMFATSDEFTGIDRIAITIGPGSFTGIRVGLAAARALGLALAKPVVGVSTLHAFAIPLILAHDPKPMLACIDARHGNVYAQIFESAGVDNAPPQFLRLAEAVKLVGNRTCRVTGNAAELVAAEAKKFGLEFEVCSACLAPAIAHVAFLGLLAEEGDGRPRPVYLKAVDATPISGRRSSEFM